MARLLVIDDEATMRMLMREILMDGGHDVEEAVSGAAGIKAYIKQPFDLVITDVLMPDKDGIQVTRELKQHNPDVKIIACSGGGYAKNFDFLKLAALYGAKLTLTKPFDAETLLRAVAGILAATTPMRPSAAH